MATEKELEKALTAIWNQQLGQMMVQICGSTQKEMLEGLCVKRIPTQFGDVLIKESWLDKYIRVKT